jgi:hypothetical protein
MKGTKKSAAGRLFYTFGTILLLTIITVCAVNFAKNGRAFEIPLLSTVTGTAANTTPGAIKSTDDFKTIKYKKPETKNTSSTGKKSGGKATATPAPKVQPPAVNP